LGWVFEGRAKYVPNRVPRRSVRRALAAVRVQEAAELLALDIYTRAEKIRCTPVLSVASGPRLSGPYPFV